MPGSCAASPRRDRLSPAELAWATLSSPVGPLAVGCTAAGLAQVRFRTSPRTGCGPGWPHRRPAAAGPAARPRPRTRCWPRPAISWPSTSPGSVRSSTCRSTGPAHHRRSARCWTCCTARSATATRSPTGNWRSARWPGRTGYRCPPGPSAGSWARTRSRWSCRATGWSRATGWAGQRRHRHRGQAVAAHLRGGAARHAGLDRGRAGLTDSGRTQLRLTDVAWCRSAQASAFQPMCSTQNPPGGSGARPAASRRVRRRLPPGSAAGSPGARRSPRAARRPGCRRSAAGSR